MRNGIERYRILVEINKKTSNVYVEGIEGDEPPFWLLISVIQAIRGCL